MNPWTLFATALVLALFLVAPNDAVASDMHDELVGPRLNQTTVADWMSYRGEEKVFVEAWATVMSDSDGYVINLTVTRNFRPPPAGCSVTVSVTDPDDKLVMVEKWYDMDEFSESLEDGFIKVDKNLFGVKGDTGTVKMYLDNGEDGDDALSLGLDLTLKAWVPGVKIHSGKLFLDKSEKTWIQMFMNMPRADVTGTISINGIERRFSGAAFVHHVRDVTPPYKYARQWSVLRYFGKDHSIVFVTFDTTPEYGSEPVRRLVVTDRNKVLTHDDGFDVSVSDARDVGEGRIYHNVFAIFYDKDGFRLMGSAVGSSLYESYRIVGGLPRFKQIGAHIMKLDPTAYRIRGDCSFSLTTGSGSVARLHGPCLMESIIPR